MKKAVFSFIIGALLFSSVSAYAISQYTATKATFPVYVNGDLFEGTTGEILVVEGRTYLPIRDMADALGIPIEWNNELRQVEVGTAPRQQITEQAGETVKEIVRGSWKGNIYTNEYGGFTFNMPSDWLYGSDEEIANVMKISSDLMAEAGARISSEMMKQTTVVDMAARNIHTGSNISITYENLSMQIGGSQISETTYLEILKLQLTSLNPERMSYTFEDAKDATISGETYKVMVCSAEYAGSGKMEQYVYVRKIDAYLLQITVTVNDGDSHNEIMSCFK